MENNGSLEVLAEFHYYPHGMKMNGPWASVPSDAISYQYNGIDYVDDFGLNVNMATFRTLDPSLGRWWSVDPKGEILLPVSAYQSIGNNPILHADPEGDAFITSVLIGAAIGGIAGGLRADNFFDGFWKGALVGAIGGAVGQVGVSTLGGSIAYGGVSGAVLGGLDAGLNGNDIGKGVLLGGVFGGIGGGIDYSLSTSKVNAFKAPDIELGSDPIPATRESLCSFCEIHFPNYADNYGVADLDVKEVGTKLGKTVHLEGLPESHVYISPRAFKSEYQLFHTVGHEFIHAYHHKIGLTTQVISLGVDYYKDVIEGAAYSWNRHISEAAGIDYGKWYKKVFTQSKRLLNAGKTHRDMASFKIIPGLPLKFTYKF